MSDNKKRLLLQQGNNIYYLLNFELKMGDGSLYISVPRIGTSTDFSVGEIANGVFTNLKREKFQRPKTKSISYHTSGLIHYKNLGAKSVYAEPIFDITKPFPFFHFSIPKISLLDKFQKSQNKNDSIIKVPMEANGRNDFGLIIAPNDAEFKSISGIGIKYDGLFDIIVSINNVHVVPPIEYSNSFIYSVPPKGLFNCQKYPKEDSQLLFHQKLVGARDVIIYRPNSQGVYKMYFVVPMRIPPKIKIKFAEAGLEAVIVEDGCRTNTTAHFRVKNKHGFIKEAKEIVYVELDAEL